MMIFTVYGFTAPNWQAYKQKTKMHSPQINLQLLTVGLLYFWNAKILTKYSTIQLCQMSQEHNWSFFCDDVKIVAIKILW